MISDKKDFELVQSMIRSVLFDGLPNEVPYKLKIEIEYYEVSREGNLIVLLISNVCVYVQYKIYHNIGKIINRQYTHCCVDRL